jgi:hypothetical protein
MADAKVASDLMHDLASDALDHIPPGIRENAGPLTALAIGHAVAINGLVDKVIGHLLPTPEAMREDLPSEIWLATDLALYVVRTYVHDEDFRFQTEACAWADVHGPELTYDASLSAERVFDFAWSFKLQMPRIDVRQYSLDLGLPAFARAVFDRVRNA